MRAATKGGSRKTAPKPAKGKTETAIAKKEEKHNYKVNPAAVQAIIDLTLQGVAVATIREFILENFQLSISETTICDYRRKHRQKMLAAIEDDIAAARAMYPDSALLVGRLATLDAATKKEMRKKRASGYAIAALVGAAAQDVYKAEALRHRLQEFERRFPRSTDEDNERIMRELERRSHVLRNVTEEVEELGSLAKDALDIDEPIVAKAEVVPAHDLGDLGEEVLTRGT